MAVKARASISLTRVDDVDGLEIGGKNLIIDSGFKKDIWLGMAPDKVDNTYSLNGNNSLKITKDNSTGTDTLYVTALEFKTNSPKTSIKNLEETLGKDYTLSAMIYMEKPGDIPNYEFRVIYTLNGVMQYAGHNKKYPYNIPNAKDLKVGWNELYGTYSIPKDSTEFWVNINLTLTSGKKGTLWISSPKLEQSNVRTAWTPAPEDVQDDIKDAIDDATTTITEEYRSAIDQTSKQIELMIQSLKTETDANTESITSVTNQLQITTEMAQFVKTTTEQLQNVVDGKLSAEEVKEWARFDGASLELGASNSPFKAILSNTELAFWQGDTKVAYISNNELYILSAVIVTSIKCGNFTFIDEGYLGFSLI